MRDLNDLVPLRTLPKSIEAHQYNRVRLALLRLGNPLRLDIPRLHVAVTLGDKHWLCVRPLDDDLPLLAWTAFETRGRALHEAVPCRLHLYHFHAGLLMGVALDVLDQTLCARLDAQRPHAS
jgi:hypothetical protein